MTSERRIVGSLQDIKSICYQCKKCGARVCFSPDASLEAASQCFQCRLKWVPDFDNTPVPIPRASEYQYQSLSLSMKLASVIAAFRNPEIAKTLGFHVLLEFEEP